MLAEGASFAIDLSSVARFACMTCQLMNVLEHLVRLQDKSGRIRQGSPEEERALGQHIAALAPSPKQLSEAGQLAELLTLLGMIGQVIVMLHWSSSYECVTSTICQKVILLP